MINVKKVKAKCCEDIRLIENYEAAVADQTQMWECHHRLGVVDGKTIPHQLLEDAGLYWQRPAAELIFVTKSEHSKIHFDVHSKASKSLTFEQRSKAGKLGAAKLTREQRAKGGRVTGAKNLTFEACSKGGKIGGKIGGRISGPKARGKKWWNNGINEMTSFECPADGWNKGRLPRTRGENGKFCKN